MIKLTVNPDSHPTTSLFQKDCVIIGSNSLKADLVLENEVLLEVHVKIDVEESRYIILNLANDPFVTLNGLPFGKKRLKNHDLIQIGSTLLRFEEMTGEQAAFEDKQQLVESRQKLADILEKSITPARCSSEFQMTPYTDPSIKQTTTQEEKNFKDQETKDYQKSHEGTFMELSHTLREDEMVDYDVESLMRRVEQLEQKDLQEEAQSLNSDDFDPLAEETDHEKNPDYQDIDSFAEEFTTLRLSNSLRKSPALPEPKVSIKDYYLKDFEEENEQWEMDKKGSRQSSSLSKTKWKLLFKLLVACFTICIIFSGLFYLWVSDQSGEEEVRASRGVADVAMALTYAQIKHIKPQNQNWSDPEFVKNNLTAVLASIYSSFACFDSHGQFDDCPYILRIYTNSDLSKFLVIAQPAPSVFQWIIPKASIVVDSNAMEMRKITDLRALNRLLVNANTLDGVNAMEISHLVSQGELIPLVHLADKKRNIGFTPPKALAYIHPGAENYIYNAPRYYQLGQTFLKRALYLNETLSNPHELALFQQEMGLISRFPEIVLYYAEGIQGAIKAQKALATLIPNEKFIIAYLQFNSLGKVLNSHLLMDDNTNEIASILKGNPQEMVREITKDSKSHIEENEPNVMESLDKNHPAYLQLSTLKYLRQQALNSVSEQIIQLIKAHNQEVQPSFTPIFEALVAQYQKINEEQEEKIAKKLSDIYHEYADIPLSQLMGFVREAGMSAVFHAALKELQKESLDRLTENRFDQYVADIEESQTWEELEESINKVAGELKLERIPDPNQLISFQNIARSKVFDKLTEFLLLPDIPLESLFDSESRQRLTRILKTAWVQDVDVNAFYLSEFDLRSQYE